jgi:predicted GH43/DUF377 family glycosyl hydrolase
MLPEIPGLGTRLAENPLITPSDVIPSQPGFEVVCAFNPAAIRIDATIILLLRVAERPRGDLPLSVRDQELIAGPAGWRFRRPLELPHREDVVRLAVFDPEGDPPGVVPAFIRRDTPGLVVGDSRSLSFQGRALLSQLSHLRLARSADGVHFDVMATPALAPLGALEEYGCEDPRVTPLDGVYYLTYVAPSRNGIVTCLAVTRDFATFSRLGVMFLPDHKDVVLFPEQVGGQYWALTRPMPSTFDKVHGIWIAHSPDLVHWGGHQPLALPRWGLWDAVRTGGSNVPIRTEDGWLVLYHGVNHHGRYCMGALLLDENNPYRVLARLQRPLLSPEAPYERRGFYSNVVFSCGHVPLTADGSTIRVFYGAADHVTAAADFDVEAILDAFRHDELPH